MKRIYLAGGCFWGMQAYFKKINGVIFTTVGYANSNTNNPNYKLVKTSTTKAVETLELYYDEQIVSLEKLIEIFFSLIDPTALNFQGPDYGTQYRSGIYFEIDEEENIINKKVQELAKNYDKKVVTEILKLQNYFLAEEYHQNYADKHPEVVCHIT